MNSFFLKPLIVCIAAISLLSCSSSTLETIRKVTYPPDFNYISKTKLKDTMHQFAWYSTLLDNSLKGDNGVSETQRENAISILRKMETLSQKPGCSGFKLESSTGHP